MSVIVPENAYRQLSLGLRLLARPQHAAACVSLLQNHNVKERRSKKPPRGRFFLARPREAEPGACGPKPFQVPAGRRGFYARPLSLSTTFSRKTRFSQLMKKHLKNQRDFAALNPLRTPRRRLRIATTPL
jgi:hypothetical protein